jgi:ABC-type glycerol-3-phosphate transport system substrate-binding protein
MKHLLVLLASLALFACSGGDSGGSAEEAVETVEEPAETVGADVAHSMQDAMDKAAAVGDTMEEHKDAIDEAVEEAD